MLNSCYNFPEPQVSGSWVNFAERLGLGNCSNPGLQVMGSLLYSPSFLLLGSCLNILALQVMDCTCPLKFSAINSGSLTFPNSTVSLICACCHQFSALPSGTLTKLTWMIECRYAAIKGLETRMIPLVHRGTSLLLLALLTLQGVRHRSVRSGMSLFTSKNCSLVFGSVPSPDRYRLCIKR